MREPTVSVVVPHYQDQPALDRLLEALRHTRLEAGDLEVVVADDGSAQPPHLPDDHPHRLQVVRQEDRGFRAAAVRNLGAAAARGQVLVFLDGDMLPDPDCIGRLQRAVQESEAPRLVVGHRLHHEVTGWTGQHVRAWLADGGPAPGELPEPGWLRDGYAATDDLRAADDRSFRYVISAVMALRRSDFQALGGFDESFVGYGGEDWEFAQRAWLAGLDLLHLPDAVAWHDGPEISGREEDLAAVKNAETAHLATRLTHPLVRGRGLVHTLPDVVVQADASQWTLGAGLVAVESWLRDADAGIWFGHTASPELLRALTADPRVHTGDPEHEVMSRCRWRVRTTVPVLTPSGWEAVVRAGGQGESPDHGPSVSQHTAGRTLVATTRALSVAKRRGDQDAAWTAVSPEDLPALLEAIPHDVMVERTRQVWA